MKLPETEQDTPEWQAAMRALLLVAEHDVPTMFARIGIMRALNRGVMAAPALRRSGPRSTGSFDRTDRGRSFKRPVFVGANLRIVKPDR
jgi:hypothetical protein